MVNVNFEIQRKQFTSANMKILGIRAMYKSSFILVAIKKNDEMDSFTTLITMI